MFNKRNSMRTWEIVLLVWLLAIHAVFYVGLIEKYGAILVSLLESH